MAVLAKHDLTGKVALVSEGDLRNNPHLSKASKSDAEQVQKERQIKVYGRELGSTGELPNDVTATPDETWTKAELVAFAEHKKIEVDKSVTKAELVKALTEGSN